VILVRAARASHRETDGRTSRAALRLRTASQKAQDRRTAVVTDLQPHYSILE
jgi:hypothetical protein